MGPRKSAAYKLPSPRSAAPKSQTPWSFNQPKLRAKLVTGINGINSAAPQATLRTVVVNPTARSFGAITACTPAAQATRRHAPKLCGSCTPSKIKKKAGHSMAANTSCKSHTRSLALTHSAIAP